MIILTTLVALLAHAKTPCISIRGPMVVASDLQNAIPALERVAPDRTLFPAPAVGLVRLLTERDLRGVLTGAAVPPGTCIERASWQLTAEAVRSAILATLPTEPKLLEIVEISHYAIPLGKVQFAMSGVSPRSASGTDDVLLWNGSVVPGSGTPTRVWARVRLTVAGPVFRTARAVARGQVLGQEDFIQITETVPVRELTSALSREQVTGCTVLAPHPAGERLKRSDLRCGTPKPDARPVEALVKVGNVVIKVPGVLQGSPEQPEGFRFQGKGMSKPVPARTNYQGIVEVVVE